MPTVRILIKGKVQGVFFRASARDIAETIGIKGWVRNTEEGDVEAVATGTETQVDQFIGWCRKGPQKAIVKDISVEQLKEEPFDKFMITR
jgi:acylphosphatase